MKAGATESEQAALNDENAGETSQRFAGEQVRACERGHLQTNHSAVRALTDDADAEGHLTTEDSPEYALRESALRMLTQCLEPQK